MIGYKLVKGRKNEFVSEADTNVVCLNVEIIERVTNILWLKKINCRYEKHRLILNALLCGSGKNLKSKMRKVLKITKI